jgi:hypothetical protein
MLTFIGCLFIGAAGGILHDVPFLRFLSAMLLISVGQVFLTLGMK